MARSRRERRRLPVKRTQAHLIYARGAVRTGQARSIRETAGLSMADVAREINAGVATVSRWEAGKQVPHGDVAVRYGRFLSELAAMRQVSA
jgi:DNA-binding transcriptional regulator YiaG